ncbi:MAG: hypothetical protein LUH47_07995 [Clostridiales bacterium]|nr:hypothetical protein [Clostridiales bacterium]
MKKTYTKPNMEIVSFKTENIATVSAGTTQDTTAFGTLDVSANSVTY